MGGGRLRAFAGDVQGCFFQGVQGCFGAHFYLVEASGGVRICSGLFRFVRGARGAGHCVALSFFWRYGSTIGARRFPSFLRRQEPARSAGVRGGAVVQRARVPACAGMTVGGAGTTGKAVGVQEGGRRWLATSHPPPSLPPKRGEGCIGEGSGCVGVGAWVPACAGMMSGGRNELGNAQQCLPKEHSSLPPSRGETKRGVGAPRLRWRLSGRSGCDERLLHARGVPPPT